MPFLNTVVLHKSVNCWFKELHFALSLPAAHFYITSFVIKARMQLDCLFTLIYVQSFLSDVSMRSMRGVADVVIIKKAS